MSMSNNPRPILFLAFANDRDDRARYLRNLAEEARQVQRALAAAEQRGHCELVLRQNATAADMLDVFQDPRFRNRIAIFHFGGHADGYRLLLETAEGAPAAANAGGLARFLAQQRHLQLVFLNGCSTEGQVAGLLDAGVSAVIATDQAVDDAAATAFAARFYQGLAGGAAIAAAYEEAKAAMQMAGVPVYRHIGAAEDQQNADRLAWRLHLQPGAETVQDWSLPHAARDPLFGLPPPPDFDLPGKPYRYLDWYRREDAEVFFGRGQEIRSLYDRVTAAGSPPIVLFYGQSGVGKSSLLAAGLLPRLESSHTVRYARRDQAAGLPGTLAAALEANPDADLAGAWRGLEAQTAKPLLVVLDQVEEVFTRPDPQQPGEVDRFLDSLEDLFASANGRPQGRLILSFRKEWLAEMDKRLAERKLPRGEVFLERLGREGIMEVVNGPKATRRLDDYYRLTVTDALPGLVADDLLSDRESPVAPMLAILLAGMWEAAKARSYDRPAFDEDIYHEFRSRGLSLDDFLDRQLRALHVKQPEVVESGLALDLLAYHTTPLRTAEQRSLADLEEIYRHRLAILPVLLQNCQDLYLLVDPSQNQPGQPPSSRLTHDTLAPHVRKRFDESDAPGQRARRILESRLPIAALTDPSQTRQSLAPLGDADLDVVEAGQAGMRRWSVQEQDLVADSMADRMRRLEEQARAALEREEARQRELEQAQTLAEEQRMRAQEAEGRAREQKRSATRLRLILVLISAVAVWGLYNAASPYWWRYQAQRLNPQVRLDEAVSVIIGMSEPRDGERSQQIVAVPAFAIDRYEVSNRQYQLCIKARGCQDPDDPDQRFRDPARQDLPLVMVSKSEAERFCKWMGRRLPTEIEWERATRGVDGRRWTWPEGDPEPTVANLNFTAGEEEGNLQPVYALPDGQTPEGVFNLIGNAAEWTTPAEVSGDQDPIMPDTAIVRGGNFTHVPDDVYRRFEFANSDRQPYIGFRCAHPLLVRR